MTQPNQRKWASRARDESGIALLMVLVTIAILSAIVVEFVYQTRVDVQIAANVRDRVKAYYLARSAINFSRLILHFQGQIDRMTGGTLKLYHLIPIESDLAKAFTSGEMGEAFGLQDMELEKKRGFGDFSGSFSASIEDEYAKININALDNLASVAAPTAAQVLALIGSPRYLAMYETDDANGQQNTPAGIVIAMHDWIDKDTSVDGFQSEMIARDPFSQPVVFTPGTSAEDANYDMLRQPYKSKNNPFLSLQELHLVRGIGDDFMEEFGDRLTVYSDPNLLVNLNSVNDPMTMLSLLCMQPDNLALCTEQGLPQMLEVLAQFFEFRNIMQWTTFMVPDNKTIAGFFDSLGPTFSQYFMKNLAPFSDTFKVKASGQVGEVTVNIETVVKNTTAGQEIMYWRVQ
jgi:general secretion pathway protein K